jgi:hypothetical protein
VASVVVLPGDWQAGYALEDAEGPQLDLGLVVGQPQVGEAAQEGGECDAHLRPGQGCADAVVDSVAEGEVPGRSAGDVEDVGVGRQPWVAVASAGSSTSTNTPLDLRGRVWRVAGGISAPGSHGTVRNNLSLHGSYRSGHQTAGIS